MDDDGLPAGASHVNLLSAGDVQVTQVSLELGIGCLKIKESLGRITSKEY